MFRVVRVSRLVQQGRGSVAGHRPVQGHAADHQGRRAGRPEPGGRPGAALQLRRGHPHRADADQDVLGSALLAGCRVELCIYFQNPRRESPINMSESRRIFLFSQQFLKFIIFDSISLYNANTSPLLLMKNMLILKRWGRVVFEEIWLTQSSIS